MSCYEHLSIEERENLLVKLKLGQNISQISRETGRNRSTIWREIQRNSRSRDAYSAIGAQAQYEKRRENSVRPEKLTAPECVYVVEKLLQSYWSPEQISYRLKRENSAIQIGVTTIYRGLEKGLPDASCRKNLRIKSRQRKGGRKKSKCGHLNIDRTIHDRATSVEKRKKMGHWESDTVRGAKWSGCVATHVERKSRFAVLCKIPNRSAKEFTDATIATFARLQPGKCKSLTVDHGKEFAQHRRIAGDLKCKVYFADPYAPWQRGTNENTNGLLRQYLPKRTSFAELTQEDVDRIADMLNKRPRKCLDWKTPHEVFFGKLLHLT